MTLQNTLTGDENLDKGPLDAEERAQALLKLLESKGISLESLETALVQGKLDALQAEKKGEVERVLNTDHDLQKAFQEVCKTAKWFQQGNPFQFAIGLQGKGLGSLKNALQRHYGLQPCTHTFEDFIAKSQEKNSPFKMGLSVLDSRRVMPEFDGDAGYLLTADDQLFIVYKTDDTLTFYCPVESADMKL